MPTYDYVCGACGHAFEQFQTMSAKKLRTCPACKKPALERQVGMGAGLIFKGTGFYITDYRKTAVPSDGELAKSGDAKQKPSEATAAPKPDAAAAPGDSPAPTAPSPGKASTAKPPAPKPPPPPGRPGKK